jgi:TRAP transporter TAXI family solute receptor
MMRVRRTLVLGLLLGVGCGALPDRHQPPPPRPTVRLIHTWGIDPSATARLQSELAASLSDLHVELTQTDLSGDALRLLQHRQVDAVFTFATFAYMASIGQLPDVSLADDVRAIAELSSRPVQVIVHQQSGISSVDALRGRHLSLGPLGSNANLVAQRLLAAFGISLDSFTAEHFRLHEASRRFIAGEIDAFFVNGYAYPDVANALDHGGRLLNIEGPEIDRARTSYPLLRPAVLPVGTYRAIDHPIHTVGVDEILLCRADLDEKIAHDLTRAVVDVVTRGDLDIEALRYTDLDAVSSTAIPLHPGAARYYREREVLP